MLEYWPIALVIGSGLIAWGDVRTKVNGLRKDVDGKAGKDVLEQIDARLGRIEHNVDRLLERSANG